jgi:hypothetical protein
MVVEYNFATMGGAVGDYILGDLPANSVVTQVAFTLETAFVGASDVDQLGTTATGAELIADMAAVTVDTLTEGVAKIEDPSTWVKITADTPIYFNIGTAVVTAGHLYAVIRYFHFPPA